MEFKTKLVMELLKETDPLSVICSKYSIHPTQDRRWKEKAIESLQSGFNEKDNSVVKELIENKKLNDEPARAPQAEHMVTNNLDTSTGVFLISFNISRILNFNKLFSFITA
ncbi:MAG: hypothetical protein V1649_02580 [Patescibacteria group bacterium]